MEPRKFVFKMGDIIVYEYINRNVPIKREKFVMERKGVFK